MSRTKQYVMPLTAVILAIGAAAIGLLALANLFFPGLAAQAGLSFNEILAALAAQAGAVGDLTGLSLVTDLILFAAAYIFVCVILWIQTELRTYIANRSHFK